MNDFGFFTIDKLPGSPDDKTISDRKIAVSQQHISREPVLLETSSSTVWNVTVRETTEVFGSVDESSLHEDTVGVQFWVSGNFVGRVPASGGTTPKMTLEPGDYLLEIRTTGEKNIDSYWKFQTSTAGATQ